MSQTSTVLGLDIGAARIGVAISDTITRIAVPHGVVTVDGTEYTEIEKLIKLNATTKVVVGYPRNQSGEATAQTAAVEAVAAKLAEYAEIVYQDESLTSVMAENRLKERGKPYTKADIDSEAATIILQDYLETHPHEQ